MKTLNKVFISIPTYYTILPNIFVSFIDGHCLGLIVFMEKRKGFGSSWAVMTENMIIESDTNKVCCLPAFIRNVKEAKNFVLVKIF